MASEPRLTEEQVRLFIHRMRTGDGWLYAPEARPLLQDWLDQRAEVERLTERVRELEGPSLVNLGAAAQSNIDMLVARLNPDAHRERCHSGTDGECFWDGCPQLRDGEPKATGRSCPLYPWDSETAR